MQAAIQIGSITATDGSLLVTGVVLYGTVRAADRLLAVGLRSTEVLVRTIDVSPATNAGSDGDECRVELVDERPAAQESLAGWCFGLVTPECVAFATVVQARLDWASLVDEPLPAGPGFWPAVRARPGGHRAGLRFADVRVAAMVMRPAVAGPPRPSEACTIVTETAIAIIPGCRFSMTIGGEFAAMGTVTGVAEGGER